VQNKNAAERLKKPFAAAGKNKRCRPSPAAPCRTKKKGRSPKAAPLYHLRHFKIIIIGVIAIRNIIHNSIIKKSLLCVIILARGGFVNRRFLCKDKGGQSFRSSQHFRAFYPIGNFLQKFRR
jgi:hypothetical protein